ncbi:MAG: filamentous hemagglutinin N-terminal domain-containing protein [Nostoc sp.]|uniref:filamentous hemagglutinin N-terminal domain-containing protein n=1 Tax=Nostoc sp. TaxID=1180 RepID=UPI002FF2DB29
MVNFWGWCQGLGVTIYSAIAFFSNSAIAQIIQDSTLPDNSQITKTGNTITINGGTLIEDKFRNISNLFHSFEQFSVPTGSTAYFNNAANVQNIISRITGRSVSNIEGIIKANGQANLFLINPNGIIFGPNASLNIGGSFVASTANSLNFADGTKFSAVDPQTSPLLKVSIPIGLQFGATAKPIYNQSQASSPNGTITNINIFEQPVGLQVKPLKTLALIGGDITLEGGNLTAASGRIELGSVASNSLVSLSLEPVNQSWSLGYEGVQNFQNIKLIERITNGEVFPSQVDASGEGGGSIQVQGKSVELSGRHVRLISQTTGDRDGKEISINAKKLIVQDGAQVATSTKGMGAGGSLTVNASESVELIRSRTLSIPLSGLFSTTFGDGNAGNLTIKTGRLRIQDGAEVSAESTMNDAQLARGNGGDLTVEASEAIELIGVSATGIPSNLAAGTLSFGDAGKVTIDTDKLIVRDGAEIVVSSMGNVSNTGKAGDLNITAGSIWLDNKGKFTSNSNPGQGGNITLNVRDLLLMQRNSQITTNTGGNGDGGNIIINAPNGFVVATPLGNSDITANAFSGSGGKIKITTKNIFGFVARTGADVEKLDPTGEKNPNNLPTNDITAFSQQNPSLNGTVQINSPDADPSRGLVELPVNLVDASKQIVADCNSGGKIGRGSFIRTGRGGLIADPTQPLIADDAVLADWITLSPESQNHADGIPKRAVVQAQRNTEEKSQKVNSVNKPTQIVEAQGWVIDANGNVVLVAQVPTATPHNSWLNTASCAAK